MHLTRILAIGGLLILCASTDTFAECQAPHYRKGPVWVDCSPAIYTASIPLADFVPARMVCLAERLKRDHPREQHYAVGNRPPDPGETRIALPTMTIPDCQFEVTNRCVISMDYPNVGGTYAHPASGTVTLTARFTRRGLIQDITVEETRDMQPASQEGVVAAAIANLKTWRVEPATHVTTVRMKYQHVVDSSLSHPGQVDIQFDIPHQITIRARSMP